MSPLGIDHLVGLGSALPKGIDLCVPRIICYLGELRISGFKILSKSIMPTLSSGESLSRCLESEQAFCHAFPCPEINLRGSSLSAAISSNEPVKY
jgi:hypothetical protein